MIQDKRQNFPGWMATLLLLATLAAPKMLDAQQGSGTSSTVTPAGTTSYRGETNQDYNQRIAELAREGKTPNVTASHADYQIGPEDLVEISVLEAPDLNRTVRVADDGTISLALLGSIPATGLSTRQLQSDLEDRLRRTYMKDPQVSVFVQEMRSHPVSVFGAVEKPGVYQIRYAKSLVEVLSMAQGLANDAGDSVIVVRHGGEHGDSAPATSRGNEARETTGGPSQGALSEANAASQTVDGSSNQESITINLKDLLDSSDPDSNVLVYPGDLVKVTRAGVVYVVGQVHKPGGFLLKTNENISVLQAIALAEGLTPNSKGKEARIFLAAHADESQKEVVINLDKILAGKEPAPFLKPDDVLFVPNSGGKETLHVLEQSTAGIVGALGGAAIYRW